MLFDFFHFFLYLNPIMRYFKSVPEAAAAAAASEPEVVYEASSLR